MDWKMATRAAREMRRAWAALEPEAAVAGQRRRGEQRPLEGRFRKSLRRLDEALDAERSRNLEERRALIAEMQQLAEVPDLRSAMDAAKALQRRWRPTVTGRKRDENDLWDAFRAAADAVFRRRDAEQQQRNAEQDANLATRLAVCTALAEATTAAEDEQALRRALRAQQKRWQDLEALPVPKAKLQSLRNRWREVEEAAEARVEALAAGARWSALEAIAARARWCDVTAAALASPSKSSDDGPADQTEASPETAAAEATSGAQGAVPTAEGLRAEWAALSAAPPPLAAKLDASADAVIAAAAADVAGLEQLRAQMERAAEDRRELCLRLEIACRVWIPRRNSKPLAWNCRCSGSRTAWVPVQMIRPTATRSPFSADGSADAGSACAGFGPANPAGRGGAAASVST
jgi:hypothetical protein